MQLHGERRSRAPGTRSGAASAGAALLLLSAAVAAQVPDDPLRILGFRRQISGADVELILACSGPVAFRYTSPTLETIRLVLPGVDPAGVTPPREAWGEDLAEIELRAATGADAPGAVLELTLAAFRPYSIRVIGSELRLALEGAADAGRGAVGSTPPRPAAAPTPDPTPEPEPPPAAAPKPEASDAARPSDRTPERTGLEPEPAPRVEASPRVAAEPSPGPGALAEAGPAADAPPPVEPDIPPRASAEEPGSEPPLDPEPRAGEAREAPAADVSAALPGSRPGVTTPPADVSDRVALGEPVSATPVPVAIDPPPPIEPDFFEGPAPEPPPATAVTTTRTDVAEPAPSDAVAPRPDSDGPPATRIFQVAREDRDGALAIRIPANGRPAYQAFFTREGPLRLVLDIEGAESRPLFQRLEVGVGPVRRVRVGQHAAEPVPIVRVVIDLDERVSHRIEADAAGLTLRFDGLAAEP